MSVAHSVTSERKAYNGKQSGMTLQESRVSENYSREHTLQEGGDTS